MPDAWARRLAVLTAVGVDLALGEPPTPLHPTVWMGRWIAAGRAECRPGSAVGGWLAGGVLLGGGVLLSTTAAVLAARALDRLPRTAAGLLTGAALKPALSLRALLAAGDEVAAALEAGDLPEARRLLAWHLVSRQTADLSAGEVAGAAIESVAENLSDGWVAPLFWFHVGGLPAAYLYRFCNTADAMLGYRTPDLEWFGKPAARLDDALNLLPARITVALIALAAPMAGNASGAVRATLRDGAGTPSPNAGLPMAAMAGALGVRLSKRNTYLLNPAGRVPTAADLRRACTIVASAGLAAALLASA